MLTGHDDSVRAVACTQLDGTPIAVTGGHDRTMRIWNLAEARLLGAHALPYPARCVAVTQQGGIVVGASREVIGLRISMKNP